MRNALLLLAQGTAKVAVSLLVVAVICGHLYAMILLPMLAIVEASMGHGTRAAGWLVASLLTWGAWNLYGGSEDSGMHDC